MNRIKDESVRAIAYDNRPETLLLKDWIIFTFVYNSKKLIALRVIYIVGNVNARISTCTLFY